MAGHERANAEHFNTLYDAVEIFWKIDYKYVVDYVYLIVCIPD